MTGTSWCHVMTDKQGQRLQGKSDDEYAYFTFWRGQGLSVRAATAAAEAGCRSLEDLRGRGWWAFQDRRNCGLRTLLEMSALVGGWADAPIQADPGALPYGAEFMKHYRRRKVRRPDWAAPASATMSALKPASEHRETGSDPETAFVRRASDQALLEEIQRRGIRPGDDEGS